MFCLRRRPFLGPCHVCDARACDAVCPRQNKGRKDSRRSNNYSGHCSLLAVHPSASCLPCCSVDKLSLCCGTTTTWMCVTVAIGGLSTAARPAANQWSVQLSIMSKDASSGSGDLPSRQRQTTAPACASSVGETSHISIHHSGQRMSTGAWTASQKSLSRSLWYRHHPGMACSS